MKVNRRVGVWVQRQESRPDEEALLRQAKQKPLPPLLPPRLRRSVIPQVRLDGITMKGRFVEFDKMNYRQLDKAWREISRGDRNRPHREHLLRVLGQSIRSTGAIMYQDKWLFPIQPRKIVKFSSRQDGSIRTEVVSET
jgi:hypothetical protein